MALQTYTNKRVASSQSVNVPVGEDLTSRLDLGFAKESLNALAKIEENKSASEGTAEFLAFKEAAAIKAAELNTLNGSNADGLGDKYDEWKDQYVSNLEFRDGTAETAFYDREEIESSNHRINLGKYEVAEGIEYNNQVTQAEQQSYTVASFEAASGPTIDIEAFKTNRAQAYVSYAELRPGVNEDVIKQTFDTEYSKQTLAFASSSVDQGEIEDGYALMGRLHSEGLVEDLDMRAFKLTYKQKYVDNKSQNIYNEVYDSSFMTHLNAGEAAMLEGVKEEDVEPYMFKQTTSKTRDLKTRVAMTNNLISEAGKLEKDPFYGSGIDEDIKISMNDYSAKLYEHQSKKEKAEVAAISGNVSDLIMKRSLNGDPDGRISAEINTLTNQVGEQYGRYEEQAEMKSSAEKSETSVPGRFTQAMFGIRSGDITDTAQVWELTGLDSKEKALLVSRLNSSKNDIATSRIESVEDTLLLTMFKSKNEVDDLDRSELQQYNVAMELLNSALYQRNISEMTQDEINGLINTAASIGFNEYTKQLKKEEKKGRKGIESQFLEGTTWDLWTDGQKNNLKTYREKHGRGIVNIPDFKTMFNKEN
jgi:hypothetical protein